MGNYTQLSQKERRQLKIFLEIGLKLTEIANRLGCHQSTIYRELKRNRAGERYKPFKTHVNPSTYLYNFTVQMERFSF